MHFTTLIGAISIKAKDVGLPTTTTSIPQGLTNIVNLLMTVVGAISVVMLVVGGLLYVTSSGDTARIKRARETVTNAIVGLVIAVIALVIVNFVAATLK